MRRHTSPRSSQAAYRRNHGRPGVVYILANPGLREGWWKIGCSTRSGKARAQDLNADATTGTPGVFECVFEQSTLNCGLAEERIFVKLSSQRRGKWGQEYFEVELSVAMEAIRLVCKQVDYDERPPPLLPPTPVPAPRPSVLVSTSPLPVERPNQAKPQPVTNAPPISVYSGPERFCGHCRTWGTPKRRLFSTKCANCGLSF